MVVTKTDGLLGNFLQEFSWRFVGKSVSFSLLPLVFCLGSCCTGVMSLLRIQISWLSLSCPQNAITAVLGFLLCTCLLIFMSFPFPFVRFLKQFCFFSEWVSCLRFLTTLCNPQFHIVFRVIAWNTTFCLAVYLTSREKFYSTPSKVTQNPGAFLVVSWRKRIITFHRLVSICPLKECSMWRIPLLWLLIIILFLLRNGFWFVFFPPVNEQDTLVEFFFDEQLLIILWILY